MKHSILLLTLFTFLVGFTQNSNENVIKKQSEVITQGPENGTIFMKNS